MHKIVLTVLVILILSFLLLIGFSTQRQSLDQSSQETITTLGEPYYTQLIADSQNWEAEVRTSVGTRCDLVNQEYAIEVEWPKKCYESVGQALHYSIELDKEPAMLFLLSDLKTSEQEYVLDRVGKIATKYGITIFWYDISDNIIRKFNMNARQRTDSYP